MSNNDGKGVPLFGGKAVMDADLYGSQTPYMSTVDDDEPAEDQLDAL